MKYFLIIKIYITIINKENNCFNFFIHKIRIKKLSIINSNIKKKKTFLIVEKN